VKQSLFVVSDLHLGGAPAREGKPSFQMCSPEGRDHLTKFIRYVADQRTKGDRDIHLIINGDIMDFLAEEKFTPFTEDDQEARAKLENIIGNTGEIWDSLTYLLRKEAKLTLLLGNHDIELSLPAPRRLLLERLGPGRLEFIYDNQAYAEGPVLIEHGNRYDSWNVVSHDGLREVRSAQSRKEIPPSFKGPAGSHLVTKVMNGIKAKFPFVDLLKPEDAGLLPLLAVLDPPSIDTITALLPLWKKQAGIEFDDRTGRPTDLANIAGSVIDRDQALVELATRLAHGIPPRRDAADIAGPVDWIQGKIQDVRSVAELWSLTQTKDKEDKLDRLYEALRARAERTWHTFDVAKEDDVYIRPAEAAAANGFKVIVMGHTHLVKRVPLRNGGQAVYLNSGTWADLMRVPEMILKGEEKAGKQQLAKFVEDLRANRLDTWRCQLATFARIDLDAGRVESAQVYQYERGGQVSLIPDGPISQLMG
jgi:UDP-2,3-diacylglucosamine pyrophosphatase LpxH